MHKERGSTISDIVIEHLIKMPWLLINWLQGSWYDKFHSLCNRYVVYMWISERQQKKKNNFEIMLYAGFLERK